MADESTAQMVDLSLVAEIVRSYVAQNSIGVDQVAGLIATVHRSLSGLVQSAPASAPAPLVPAVPIPGVAVPVRPPAVPVEPAPVAPNPAAPGP